MDCRDARERLSDFRDGSLPGTVMEELSLHLQGCPECSEVDRSLRKVRDLLRDLPPVPAPPELIGRVREAIAPENVPASARPVRTVFSRLKTPLEAAAAVLLLASAYWYWAGSAPTTLPSAVPGKPSAPVEIASPVSPPTPPVRTARPAQPVARPESRLAAAPSPRDREEAKTGNGERSIATLPEGTPDPKVRVYSLSDLPASPVLRASTRFRRVVPQPPEEAPASESHPAGGADSPETAQVQTAAQTPRLHPVPYGREVSLNVAQEDRDEAGERIADAARKLGGTVEGTDRVVPGGTVAVRVVLPERTAPVFLDELERIGRIPPEGRPARSVLPAGPAAGTVAYTVRLRAE
ncbi:MAG: hypothetical protein H6Q84_1120 [Deltaproteobacteria bacterium]|nr:hypothetical protein [Deltaproteobacteria bacterium]